HPRTRPLSGKHFHAPPPGTTKALAGIPLLRGMKMEIGCGARIRDFDGRRYFYFWHYERDNGRSTRKEDYVGRVDSEKARSDLLLRIAAYYRRAEHEFARKRSRIESRISHGIIPLLRGTMRPAARTHCRPTAVQRW